MDKVGKREKEEIDTLLSSFVFSFLFFSLSFFPFLFLFLFFSSLGFWVKQGTQALLLFFFQNKKAFSLAVTMASKVGHGSSVGGSLTGNWR